MRTPVRRNARERGAAALEFAMVLPALVLVLVCVLGAGTVGLSQLRAYEAARSAAREAARGEPRKDVIETAHRSAGKDAAVDVAVDGSYTLVTVKITLPDSLKFLKESVSASARARTEGQ